MPVTSNRRTVEERLDRGMRAGVVAAATHYRNAMQKALRGGYTSGRFYSGMQGVAGSVRRTDAQVDEGGNTFAAVGTDVPYAKWWEMGHYNLFIGTADAARSLGNVFKGEESGATQIKGGHAFRWVRAERWRPTLIAEADAMVRKFAAAARISAGVEIGGAVIGDVAEAGE